jgi:hypothetical protein
MKPSIRKAVTGKSVRLTTTFTGAAACAGAFMPIAMNGTGQPAAPQPGHHCRINTIKEGGCDLTNRSHWMHMGTVALTQCWGGKGAAHTNPNPFVMISFCGGNNSGFIYGTNTRGKASSIFFGHGTHYVHPKSYPFDASFVSIIGFGGTDKCPLSVK